MAQGWERNYGGFAEDGAYDIQLTNDGGYITSGYTESYGAGRYDFYIVKIDVNGDTLWTSFYGDTQMDQAVSGFQTNDGGYLVAGYTSVNNNSDFHIVKLNPNGDSTWTKTYTAASFGGARDAKPTIDGGYILAGYDNNNAHVIKTDSLGDTLWTRSYGDLIHQDIFEAVQQTTDGGYIFAGETNTPTTLANDMYLVKTDPNGDTLWTKTYGGAGLQRAWDVTQTSDGGYILVGSNFQTNNAIFVVKTDALGDTLWTGSYNGSNCFSIKETTNSNYVLVGNSLSGHNLLLKINTTGTELWRKTYASGQARQVQQTADGGYIFAGQSGINGGITDMYVVKTDSLGNSLTNYIRGNVFQDNNTDCALNTGDIELTGALITATHNGNSRVYYGTSDSLGFYNILCESGAYTVNISNIGPYYNTTCGQNISTTLLNVFEIDTVDFPLDINTSCPLLTVDISAPFIRQTGNGSTYTIQYCNQGTIDALNASIDVVLDPALTVLGSSLPINNQNNNTYTFLVGTVPVGQCAYFSINVIADTSAILGQTFCSEAFIYPDSLCISNLWTGPIMRVDGTCNNDSIHFEIQNIGDPMVQPLQYFVYEDNIIFRVGNTNTLGTLGTQTIKEFAKEGKSYRIVVQQATGLPAILGDDFATATFEGCNPRPDGSFNTGFITQLPNGYSAPFVAVDCQQMVAAYDPNDKSAQPEGYEIQHYIEASTALDYKIRFQNTGNDTAFTVVLRDTISPFLDLSSIELGASSHPYTWRIYGQRILEIKFNPIELPDSTTNELASHGFIRFRINQVANNPIGTIINNSVGIYFDYNPPIITNTTWHTIGEDFIPIIVSVDPIQNSITKVHVYPNPFQFTTTLEIENTAYQELQLSVFDAMGRSVYQAHTTDNSFVLSRENLSEGIYFYRLEGDNELIHTGKIIVRN